MRPHRGRIALLLVPLLLTACGFKPLYGTPDPSGPKLRTAVQVAPIPDRLGQEVRNELINRLTPRGVARPAYELQVVLSEDIEGYGFQPDREVTRERLRLIADYRLVPLSEEQPVLTGQARALVSYDVVQSDFAALVTREEAAREAADILVADIVARIAAADLRPAASD